MTIEKSKNHHSKEKPDPDERPPFLKSWINIYLLVLGNLICWIILFTLFTVIFK